MRSQDSSAAKSHASGAASRIAATKASATWGMAGREGTSVVARQRPSTKPSTWPSSPASPIRQAKASCCSVRNSRSNSSYSVASPWA